MENISYTYFYLGYAIIFSLLGLFTLFVHIPQHSELGGYRKSRNLLGSAFIMMTVYCIANMLIPDYPIVYANFWALIFVSLVFSWLNYTSFLYLIDASYKVRHSFIIDGIIPATAMLVLGVMGQHFEEHHRFFEYLLGAIFLAKCIRMFYICEKEWRRVNAELSNYDDGSLNITWMRVLVWLTFLLSLATIVALYIPAVHAVYDVVAPVVYIYMVFKMINYMPYKIDDMRAGNMTPSVETTGAELPPPY